MQPFLALITPVSVGAGGGGRPDNSLPGGGGPVDPGYGRPGWSPVDPGYGRPSWGAGHPDNSLPGGGWGGPVDPGYGRPSWGGRPDNTLPGGGHISNRPPGSWAGHPSQPIYHPDKPLPGEPGYGEGGDGETKPPSSENLPPIIVWIPGIGWIRATPGVPPKPEQGGGAEPKPV